jgi:hypothetical protein
MILELKGDFEKGQTSETEICEFNNLFQTRSCRPTISSFEFKPDNL